MEPGSRKVVARLILAVLALSALASLAGGGLLLAERRGLVTLRRVPNVVAWTMWSDERGAVVAIVNTDTSAGSFRLDFWLPNPKGTPSLALSPSHALSERAWIRERAIVLRGPPTSDADDWVGVDVYHGQDLVSRTAEGYASMPALVPRGSRARLEWPLPSFPSSPRHALGRRGTCQLRKQPGVWLIERDGVRVTSSACRHSWNDGHSSTDDVVEFDWDGVAPVEVEIDATTPAPSFFATWARVTSAREGLVETSRVLLVHDADMRVLDEREVPRK